MGVPTKEQFDEAIDNLSFDANCLKQEIPAQPTIESLVILIKAVHGRREAKNKLVMNLPAVQWFRSQPAAIHAQKKLTGKKYSKVSVLDRQQKLAERFLSAFLQLTVAEVENWWRTDVYWGKQFTNREQIEKYVETRNDAKEQQLYFEIRIGRYIETDFLAWERHVLIAFRNYHFTDRWEKLYIERRNKLRELRLAKAGLAALLSASTHLIEPINYHSRTHLIESIENQLINGAQNLYPVRRKDDTARERVLAYDLYLNNIREGLGKKVSVIHDLMFLEGTENPLEIRTIERLVSDWHAARIQYRQKSRLFRATNTGDKKTK